MNAIFDYTIGKNLLGLREKKEEFEFRSRKNLSREQIINHVRTKINRQLMKLKDYFKDG